MAYHLQRPHFLEHPHLRGHGGRQSNDSQPVARQLRHYSYHQGHRSCLRGRAIVVPRRRQGVHGLPSHCPFLYHAEGAQAHSGWRYIVHFYHGPHRGGQSALRNVHKTLPRNKGREEVGHPGRRFPHGVPHADQDQGYLDPRRGHTHDRRRLEVRRRDPRAGGMQSLPPEVPHCRQGWPLPRRLEGRQDWFIGSHQSRCRHGLQLAG
mmetsp:Transcript_37846/g.80841  ORF Transcript_37846/g.80841 Transcript_37846/m.80841 type:complete len:207 (+) Transcript_37846:1909-2529(+)